MPYKINTYDAPLGALNSSQSSSQLVRTSAGRLYAVIVSSGDVRVYKSTNNGMTWMQQDYGNAPPSALTGASATIDGSDIIHVIFIDSNNISRYITFSTSTDTYGRPERVPSGTQNVAIIVDSNNIPHTAYADASANLYYNNRLRGYWPTPVTVVGASAIPQGIDIQIDQNNIPQITAIDTSAGVRAWIGDKNNAASFTVNTLATAAASTLNGGTAISIDQRGNTWVAYQGAKDSQVLLAKHIKTDAWATWQTAVTDNTKGRSVSAAADLNNIYIFYERNLGGIAYDRYDTINGKWLGETILQPQIIPSGSVTPISAPHNPFVKWSQYFNNGDTGANNQNQQTIEYLFDDGNTVYYDKLVTAQISTGYVNFKFTAPVSAFTTSTSSSTSTSISTSSTSTSTSSTSTSTSISTSSTSTSTSFSTSSTSTSVSTSTSISTSSTSTSTSISTSSTSRSTSTSSTSSSTSTSISTSSTSTSTSTSSTSRSTSTSFSTSSTSTSTSFSTSSTSTSISTSSTSSSISISTSSTSTSVSTSTSFSTSSTSTSVSTSISTSSTSRSTSTSSTSTSTSFSTSSTSTSFSTSSTSTSISVSTSTSTTISATTSTSSTSTSVSTSSTSTSTSFSTSSTSTSTSFSTSSTSSSTSLSTSSTSQSTSSSTSFSTSSTSTSQSTSTSVSTSSTSTSLSTSSSTSISITTATTTSTSSTSVSTSSTSQSTSTTTTLIDINMIPRVTIRPEVRRLTVRQDDVRIKRIRLRL